MGSFFHILADGQLVLTGVNLCQPVSTGRQACGARWVRFSKTRIEGAFGCTGVHSGAPSYSLAPVRRGEGWVGRSISSRTSSAWGVDVAPSISSVALRVCGDECAGAGGRSALAARERRFLFSKFGFCRGGALRICHDVMTNAQRVFIGRGLGTRQTPDAPRQARLIGRMKAMGSAFVCGRSGERRMPRIVVAAIVRAR